MEMPKVSGLKHLSDSSLRYKDPRSYVPRGKQELVYEDVGAESEPIS